MGCLKCLFIFSTIAALILGFLLYHPIHEDLHDKAMMRFVLGIDNFIGYAGDLAELFGYNRWVIEREIYGAMSDLGTEGVPLEDGVQSRWDTFNGIKVQIYEPTEKTNKPRPGLVFIHGGGFVYGKSETYKLILDILTKRTQAIIVAANYRKAPEHPYPAAFEDVLAVVKYVGENAEKLGMDPKNIGIAGQSVGGNFAAAVTLKLRDTSSPIKLKYQLITYPFLQGLTVDLPSYYQNDEYTMHGVRKFAMADYTTMYIGEDIKLSSYVEAGNHTSPEIWKEYGRFVDPKLIPTEFIPPGYDMDKVGANRLEPKDYGISKQAMQNLIDPYAFPLMAKSLKNLPPAFVLVGNLDPLRDDGLLYFQRLKQDGNKAELYVDRYGLHESTMMCKGDVVLKAAVDGMDAVVKFLREVQAK